MFRERARGSTHRAAASGRYPHLAAALAGPAPPARDADEIFDACVLRLAEGFLAMC